MPKMIYEINTRVWVKRFAGKSKSPKLISVPLAYWKKLKSMGVNYIWLMGIWKTCESTIGKYCFEDGLIKEYKEALSDWESQDVIGSPYAIDKYEINPKLGSRADLVKLKQRLNKIGLKLILDFVPNHFSADSSLIKSNPELFFNGDEIQLANDGVTYFQPEMNLSLILAHGRDPYFPAWQDTVQVNYSSEHAKNKMIEILRNAAKFCDGFRCDMAMLPLNEVFANTWNIQHDSGYEFWEKAICGVKGKYPDFIFIAEAYWDLEWKLQQLGFDFTYDKKLYDRLLHQNAPGIFEHLKADENYKNKSVRFLENHDESRSANSFDEHKLKAAAIIFSTIPGLTFIHDGQLEGKKIKLPVQLGREAIESENTFISRFYDQLFGILKNNCIQKGAWKLLNSSEAYPGDSSHSSILAWLWIYESQNMLIAVNYSDSTATCRIKLEDDFEHPEVHLKDLLTDEMYIRLRSEITSQGLFVKLPLYSSHIFLFRTD